MKNEYCVTWKLYRTWAIESMFRGTRLALEICWCILGLLSLGFLWISSFGVFFLVMAVFCFYRAFFRTLLLAKRQYRALAKTYGTENWTRTIAFEDGQISVSEGTLSLVIPYKDITDIREKQDEISLILKNKTVIRLYRDAFTAGNWPGCRAKITAEQESAVL
ncbi:MAG: hypothetical protein J5988_03085 [Eubacterium sp.]|nr:hypothetical protein [Eubacterium sp.]